MKLSVIIVNYNVKFYLEQCLHSLFRAIENIQAEVIVVDNASIDDSQAYITACFPNITYIYNRENVGFARANNQAIEQAKGEYILLLNPDTLLPDDNITNVLSFMDMHSDAGACGLKMLAPNGYFLPESKRGYPSPLTSFWKLLGMHRIFPNNARFDGYYLSQLDPDEVHSISVLAGAYMMLRRSALECSGLLDEDFFMYGEDIDLSCRIIETGFKNYYLPFPILHYKGESTVKESYRYVQVFYGAMEIFFRKHGKHYSLVYRTMVKMGIKIQKWLKLVIVYCKKNLHLLFPNKEQMPCFLIFTDENNMNNIRNICKSNKLSSHHHFMTTDEKSMTADGYDSSFVAQHGFTHVVYDSSIYSYSSMIYLLACNKAKDIQLGVYHPKSNVLVTPEKIYV